MHHKIDLYIQKNNYITISYYRRHKFEYNSIRIRSAGTWSRSVVLWPAGGAKSSKLDLTRRPELVKICVVQKGGNKSGSSGVRVEVMCVTRVPETIVPPSCGVFVHPRLKWTFQGRSYCWGYIICAEIFKKWVYWKYFVNFWSFSSVFYLNRSKYIENCNWVKLRVI